MALDKTNYFKSGCWHSAFVANNSSEDVVIVPVACLATLKVFCCKPFCLGVQPRQIKFRVFLFVTRGLDFWGWRIKTAVFSEIFQIVCGGLRPCQETSKAPRRARIVFEISDKHTLRIAPFQHSYPTSQRFFFAKTKNRKMSNLSRRAHCHSLANIVIKKQFGGGIIVWFGRFG